MANAGGYGVVSPHATTTQEKWSYDKSKSKLRKQKADYGFMDFVRDTVIHFFLLGVFIVICIGTNILFSWIIYSLFKDTFYPEWWMNPLQLYLGTFMAGVLARLMMEDHLYSMGLFLFGFIGMALFTGVVWYDIQTSGGIYSRYMPDLMPASTETYLVAVPFIGTVGMLAYRWFSFKS